MRVIPDKNKQEIAEYNQKYGDDPNQVDRFEIKDSVTQDGKTYVQVGDEFYELGASPRDPNNIKIKDFAPSQAFLDDLRKTVQELRSLGYLKGGK